jgi:hypothetical protein
MNARDSEILAAAARHALHLAWLDEVSSGPDASITSGVAAVARAAWESVCEASAGRMPVPAACTGPDGELFSSWDRARHHLEVEVLPDAPAEWFYRDRDRVGPGSTWLEEWSPGNPLPTAVIEALHLFYPDPPADL